MTDFRCAHYTDDNTGAWCVVMTQPDNPNSVLLYGDYVEDVVQDRLERVPGIALVNVWGGVEREHKVTIDPRRQALFGLTIP